MLVYGWFRSFRFGLGFIWGWFRVGLTSFRIGLGLV